MDTSDFKVIFLGQSVLRYQVPLTIYNTINSIYETNFNRLPKEAEEVDPMFDVVRNHFFNYVRVKICTQKNAYLLRDLLNDTIKSTEQGEMCRW